MFAGVLLLLAAGVEVGAAPSAAKGPWLLPAVRSAERWSLPRARGSFAVEVDPLGATIELSAPRDLPALIARVRSDRSNICPRWEIRASSLLFHCRTNRLQAKLAVDGGRSYVDVQELRGLPRHGPDDSLELFYIPGLPGSAASGPCPGTGPGVRGECAFREGNLAEAERLWKLALHSNERAQGALRLGDLAAAAGDFTSAAGWWNKAGLVGPFGRLAAGRLCELTGRCLDRSIDRIFDGGELAQPMRTELILRGARIDLYLGRAADGLRRLEQLIVRPAGGGGCVTVGLRMCRRLLLAALEDGAPETALHAIEVYLALPNRMQGPYAIELGRAAGERAWQLGAPIFAGNLYASVAALAPPAELGDHLLRTAELYLAGDDPPRSQLVLDYSETRLEPRRMSGARWTLLKKELAQAPELEGRTRRRIQQIVLTTEAVRDLASALSLLARSMSPPPVPSAGATPAPTSPPARAPGL